MLRRMLIVTLLALLPATVQADHGRGVPGWEHPTGGEVAKAMVPCLIAGGSTGVQAFEYPAEGLIFEGGTLTMWLGRNPAGPDAVDTARRAAAYAFWLDEDPIQPPLMLTFNPELSMAQYPYSARQSAVACFVAKYLGS